VREGVRRKDLREVPAETPIGSSKVMDSLELVGLIQNDVEFVIHALKRIGENRECLTSGARLVRIKEQQDDISSLSVPFDHILKIVSSIHVSIDHGAIVLLCGLIL
jgi:hypothetical protein